VQHIALTHRPLWLLSWGCRLLAEARGRVGRHCCSAHNTAAVALQTAHGRPLRKPVPFEDQTDPP